MEEEKKYCVYKHTNKINGKVYIGQTCHNKNPERRWGKDGIGYKSSCRFYNAIQKYGWNNFEHEIIYDNLTTEQANDLEIELINFYKSCDDKYGYNIREGGSNSPCAEITKHRISESNKGRRKITPEQRKKMVEGLRKSSNRFGHKMSAKTKEKLRMLNKGRIPKNFQDLTGKEINGWKVMERVEDKIYDNGRRIVQWKCIHSCNNPETKILDSTSIKNLRYCKNCYQEYNFSVLEKTWKDKKRKVMCIETGTIFDSIRKASNLIKNAYPSNIVACCKGKQKTAGGYHWKYVD